MFEAKEVVVPEFPCGSVPVSVAAKVFGKDSCWVRAGIISGWLPIGLATREHTVIKDLREMDSRYGRITYYISPRKLWELTGFVWKGKGNSDENKITDADRLAYMEDLSAAIDEFIDGRI